MKKIYMMVSAIALAGVVNAQTTIDFESFSLSGAESFDNGSAQMGDWIFSGTTLQNVYDTAWGGYWSGFSISNMTDIVTTGFGNQYSAFTGSGYASSSQYAVHYNMGEINTNNSLVKIDSFKITNTTYASLSMLNGDPGGFGKKFGTSVSGDYYGNIPDGSNGADFLSLMIYVENYDATMNDSLEFFLADYRFADSTMDYVLADWQNIDFSNFSFPVARMNFTYSSSDTTGGWINTPTYFAMDNLATSSVNAISELDNSAISAFPNPMSDVLFVNGGIGELVIANSTGSIMSRAQHLNESSLNVSTYPSGVYFLTIQTNEGKVTHKLIK